MKHIAIIYHDADFDGKLSNEVCRYNLRNLYPEANIHSYGWDYGRPVPVPHGASEGVDDFSGYDQIYIVDLSVDELMARPELRDKIVWIDHHKTAIDKWDGQPLTGGMGGSVHKWEKGFDPFHADAFLDKFKHAGVTGARRDGWFALDAFGNPIGWQPNFKGYRIDGVAACRLCWQWFTYGLNFGDPYPTKQDFIDRRVTEPSLIRLAGEYDIWDHRDPDAKALQFGLRSLDKQGFDCLVHYQFACGPAEQVDELYLKPVIKAGHAIKSYCDKQNDEYSATYSRALDWEGLRFCCLNIGQRGNSDLVRGGLKPEHQAIFAWRHTGDGVMVSLYHAPGHEDLDLSAIAKRYGGGGHRGACGFRFTLKQLAEILP